MGPHPSVAEAKHLDTVLDLSLSLTPCMWSKSKRCWLDLQSRSQFGPFLTISMLLHLSCVSLEFPNIMASLVSLHLLLPSSQHRNIGVVSKYTVYHMTPLLKTQQLPFCTEVWKHLTGPCNILVSVTTPLFLPSLLHSPAATKASLIFLKHTRHRPASNGPLLHWLSLCLERSSRRLYGQLFHLQVSAPGTPPGLLPLPQCFRFRLTLPAPGMLRPLAPVQGVLFSTARLAFWRTVESDAYFSRSAVYCLSPMLGCKLYRDRSHFAHCCTPGASNSVWHEVGIQ